VVSGRVGRLLAIGAVTGLAAGLLGVGGGFVMVPAMVYLLKTPQREANGTSLAVIVPVAIVGATILGLLIGGALMARLRLFKSLLLFGFLQAFTNLGFVLLAAAGKSYPLMITVIAAEKKIPTMTPARSRVCTARPPGATAMR